MGAAVVGWAAAMAVAQQHRCDEPQNNGVSLFSKEYQPYATVYCASISECCNLCAANSSHCGGFFAKLPGDASSARAGQCKLYGPVAAAHQQRGNCPRGKLKQPPVCGSQIYSKPQPTPPPPPTPRPLTVYFKVEPAVSWTISQYLASMSLVYSWAPDAAYRNGTIARWATQNQLRTARYPAGTASYWNWELPSGIMGLSTLATDWNGTRAPASQWMSIDEYLALCKAAGLKPLIGVNYNCHRYQKCDCNASDSIARAVRQVKHVVAAGFPGSMWYIGNEDDAAKYADLIAQHAQAMKGVDPTLKVVWNDNNIEPNALKAFLNATGNVMDGVEFHGKWPFGGTPGLQPRSYAQWLAEVPLIEHKSGETWRHKIHQLRQAAAEAGRPNLLLMNNEYGLGKDDAFAGSSTDTNWTRFSKSMVAVEFALEMYASGYDVACFWDNGDGGGLSIDEHMLMSTANAYRMNPVHFGLELLAQAQSKDMHNLTLLTPGGERVHGFAAQNATSHALDLYLINKFEQPQNISVDLTGLPVKAVNLSRITSLVDTIDHWGRLESAFVQQCTAGVCTFILPPVSFSMVTSATYSSRSSSAAV